VTTVAHPEPSTAQLAARTGLPAGTLRMWESRHGFPAPARLPGGHRRYSERDVEAVLEVLRLRQQGLSLPAAIERALRAAEAGEQSVFAGLRRRRPDASPIVLPKRVVLSMSHAIEDEYLAQATSGLVFGSFQHERFYRQSQRRWRELARTADLAVAVAAFTQAAEPVGEPFEVPIELRHPLAREWTLIVDAPEAHACLAAWEQPSEEELPDRERRFEVMWSFEPEVVRAATEVASELLGRLSPDTAGRLPDLRDVTATGVEELRFAAALAQRMVGYLGTLAAAQQPYSA
jgi:MerR family transcriptional regulator, light-induced transcriptional regulator